MDGNTSTEEPGRSTTVFKAAGAPRWSMPTERVNHRKANAGWKSDPPIVLRAWESHVQGEGVFGGRVSPVSGKHCEHTGAR
jgi:hypothetical protein